MEFTQRLPDIVRPEAIKIGGDNDKLPSATTAGALTALLVAPSMIEPVLAPTAIDAGPELADLATGTAARAALAPWKSRALAVAYGVREVTTPTSGFVQANLDLPEGSHTRRLSGQLFAVRAPSGAWSVVLVHYSAH